MTIMPPSFLLFSSGLLATTIQCLYLREYLSLFMGNELIVGFVLGLWLAAVGVGCLAGVRVSLISALSALTACIASATAGLFILRASRLLLLPGETFSPVLILAVTLVTEALPALCVGFVFGAISNKGVAAGRLYGMENGGSIAGGILVSCAIFFMVPNGISLAISFALVAACSAIFVYRKNRIVLGNLLFAGILVCLAALITAFDHQSVLWKYPKGVSNAVCGREGEIVRRIDGVDTSVLLNGAVYTSTLNLPMVEQAVHLPLAQLPQPRRVLVLFDHGQRVELGKYLSIHTDCLETEPLLAHDNAVVCAPEQYRPVLRYDVVLLGAGMPATVAGNRYFTRSFFLYVKNTLMTDSAVFSFTLPFGENYLSPAQRRLFESITVTLRAVFPSVWVFPGAGYTFMASRAAIPQTLAPRVTTAYLETRIIPSVDPVRINKANRIPDTAMLNTVTKPAVLALTLMQWMEQYRVSLTLLAVAFSVLFLLTVFILPKTTAVFSISTSGFASGIVSVVYLMLYQARYGALFSAIALFMIVLTAGFTAGSFIRRLPHADALIGLYAAATIALLSGWAYPPQAVFFCVNFGLGVLAGGQFCTQSSKSTASLYAADMAGGLFGMLLSTTLLLPLFGAVVVGIGVAGIKTVAWSCSVLFKAGIRLNKSPL